MLKRLMFLFIFFSTVIVNAQWVQTNGPYGGFIEDIAISGNNIFAGTSGSGGVYLSTNNGTSWAAVNNGLTNTSVQSLAVSGTNIFAGTQGGVFLSTNNGTSWTAVNHGLTNTSVLSLAVSGTNIFAGTWGNDIFEAAISDLLNYTDIGPTKTENTAQSYFLFQNYPNPFNPSTMINYSVPKSSMVTIKVYDVRGREVEKLVNEEKPAGIYSINFNASDLSSGVYFYKMQAGNFVETKKLILLK